MQFRNPNAVHCPSGSASARRLLAIIAVLALVSSVLANVSMAQDGGKTIMIGESNSEEERQELLGYFDATSDDEVQIVTVEQTQNAMRDVIEGYSLTTAFSSAALSCRDLGEGLDVTTINITKITPAMYAMALVTAGVGDATLIVAAPAAKAAEGMTALAGIFENWKSNPCESSQTTEERQRLALEQLAITVDISNAIGEANTNFAGNFVIEVQRNVVIEGARSEDEIEAIVANQENLFGFQVPAAQREALIAMMVRLAELDIDWNTFAAGWTIEYVQDGIEMRGDGIAIRNAQASATAKAAKEQTATAKAEQDMTATARAEQDLTATAEAGDELTATAEADLAATESARQTEIAKAEQTQQANDSLTATALAQPTPTATATPGPSAASGAVTQVGPTSISLESAAGVTDYPVTEGATVTRKGTPVALKDLKVGDVVTLQIDYGSQQVIDVVVTTPKPEEGFSLPAVVFALPLLLLIPLGMVAKGKVGPTEPFVVKRVNG